MYAVYEKEDLAAVLQSTPTSRAKTAALYARASAALRRSEPLLGTQLAGLFAGAAENPVRVVARFQLHGLAAKRDLLKALEGRDINLGNIVFAEDSCGTGPMLQVCLLC